MIESTRDESCCVFHIRSKRNSEIGASMKSTIRPFSRTSILFPFCLPPLENRAEQTGEAWGLRQSGGFFHRLVDSPFLLASSLLFLLALPISPSFFRFLRYCSHGIVESCTSLSHRYLMARVKSPITQLPCCTYVPAYVPHVATYVCTCTTSGLCRCTNT